MHSTAVDGQILIVAHESCEYKATSDAPQEQLGHITSDPFFAVGRELGVQDLEVCKDQGMVTEHPPEGLAEHASKGNRAGKGRDGGMYSGKCLCPW